MAWEELNVDKLDSKAAQEKAGEKYNNLVKNYHGCFKSEAGQKVIEHLMNTYVINNTIDRNAQNITFEAGYAAGESGVVRAILALIQKAEVI